jgi:hypothetical protein
LATRTALRDTATLAAVVATLLYAPAWVLLAVLYFVMWGVPPGLFITLAGWGVAFVLAFVYAACMPPWKADG